MYQNTYDLFYMSSYLILKATQEMGIFIPSPYTNKVKRFRSNLLKASRILSQICLYLYYPMPTPLFLFQLASLKLNQLHLPSKVLIQ